MAQKLHPLPSTAPTQQNEVLHKCGASCSLTESLLFSSGLFWRFLFSHIREEVANLMKYLCLNASSLLDKSYFLLVLFAVTCISLCTEVSRPVCILIALIIIIFSPFHFKKTKLKITCT